LGSPRYVKTKLSIDKLIETFCFIQDVFIIIIEQE